METVAGGCVLTGLWPWEQRFCVLSSACSMHLASTETELQSGRYGVEIRLWKSWKYLTAKPALGRVQVHSGFAACVLTDVQLVR